MTKPPSTPGGETDATKELQAQVGLRIGQARRRIGMVPAKLAEIVGVGQSYIYAVETRGTNLTLSTIKAFADALELRIGDLLPESETGAVSSIDVANLAIVIERATSFLERPKDQEDAIMQQLREWAVFRDDLKRLVGLKNDSGPVP